MDYTLSLPNLKEFLLGQGKIGIFIHFLFQFTENR